MPRVITSSSPFPVTTAAPWMSASLATLVGLPNAPVSAPARSKRAHCFDQVLVHLGARPVFGREVGGRQDHALPDHPREPDRHPLGRRAAGPPAARGRRPACRGARDRCVGTLTRSATIAPVGVEHRGLEAGAPDVDGQGERVPAGWSRPRPPGCPAPLRGGTEGSFGRSSASR